MTYSNIVDNSINSAKPFTIAMPKIHMGGRELHLLIANNRIVLLRQYDAFVLSFFIDIFRL